MRQERRAPTPTQIPMVLPLPSPPWLVMHKTLKQAASAKERSLLVGVGSLVIVASSWHKRRRLGGTRDRRLRL